MDTPRSTQDRPGSRIAAAGFALLSRAWPRASRDWVLAMKAELPEMASTGESLAWLIGGCMSLARAWWREIFRVFHEASVAESKRASVATAAVLLAVIVACLALPGMMQGLVAVSDAWRTVDAKENLAQLEKLATRAEQTHDAQVLAYAVLHLPASPEKARWADLAVSLDPRLTWIFFQMQPDAYQAYRTEVVDPEFDWHAAQLQQWDPDNAVPYLMQGDAIFRRAGCSQTAECAVALGKSPSWLAAMNRAFGATRYDDYGAQRFSLEMAVEQSRSELRPALVARALVAARIPELFNARVYAAWLTQEADRLAQSGKSEAALANDWRAAQFGQRMAETGSGDDITRLIGMAIQETAFANLRRLASTHNYPEQVSFAAYALANIHAQVENMKGERGRASEFAQSAVWSAVMLHSSAIIMFAAAILCGISSLSLGFFAETSQSTAPRWLRTIGRGSAATLACAAVVFYTHYVPLLRLLRHASSAAATPATLHDFATNFGWFLHVPYMASNSWTSGGSIYFWAGFTALGVSCALVVITRMAARANVVKHTI